METENKLEVTRSCGVERMGGYHSYCLMITEFLFESMKNIIDSDDDCTTLGMSLIPLNCTVKMVKVESFRLYILSQKNCSSWAVTLCQ